MTELQFTILLIISGITVLCILSAISIDKEDPKTLFDELGPFLSKNKCKASFAYNVEKAVNTKYQTVAKYKNLQKDENIHLIINFFNWSDTEEGYMFWWDIDNKWNKHLTELKKKYQHVR